MKTITRTQAIEHLREHFLKLVDEEHSLCTVAARHGIFCRGFRRFSDTELKEKFYWIAGSRRNLTRAELEDVIDRYKRARQEALDVPLSCDAQMIDRDTCLGWDEFTDADLARFYQDLLRVEVELIPDPPAVQATAIHDAGSGG